MSDEKPDRGSSARAAFERFQSDMNAWELKYHPLMWKDARAHGQPAREELEVIFDRSLATPDLKAARLAMPSPASPPEYDPGRDEVVEVTSAAAKVTIVVQQQTGFKGTFRYELGLHQGRWMIEKKEVFRKSEDKWRNYRP